MDPQSLHALWTLMVRTLRMERLDIASLSIKDDMPSISKDERLSLYVSCMFNRIDSLLVNPRRSAVHFSRIALSGMPQLWRLLSFDSYVFHNAQRMMQLGWRFDTSSVQKLFL